MSDAKYGLRTVSRAGIFRQVYIPSTTPGDPPTLALIPIPVVVAPTTIAISPNEDVLDLPGVSCKGEEVIEMSVTKGFKPELTMEFSVGAPEMDSLIHGRVMASQANVKGFVFFETVANTTTVAGRSQGEIGYEVTAQTNASAAQIYYVDPSTKLAKKIDVVASSPADDQLAIGQHLAVTFSPELAETGATVRGWVPCTFSKATIITSESLGLITVYGMGVDFDGRFAGLIVRNCSRLPGGQISSDPKKQVKLRILPDPNDGNGLGYILQYTDQRLVC
jgi:hypothetical protein